MENNEKHTGLRYKVDTMLAEGLLLWKESGIELPTEAERHLAVDTLAIIYSRPDIEMLAAACQCFYFFRKLHGKIQQHPAWATLLGDYFFSRFSKNLVPLNSIPLTDAFSDYLKRDIRHQKMTDDFITFIQGLPAVLK